jgi:flagellar motor switch protein FliM
MNRKRKNRKRQSKAKKDDDAPTEVLSQEEIDQLLTAINAGDTEEEEVFRPACDRRKIKIYDFKRPDKFSKEQIRTVSMIHDTFSRLATTMLSAQLRSMVHVHVASVDQLTYEEFIRSIPTPTTLAIINLDPLKGNGILEIDPAITFSIIDRICGGTGEGTKSQHELTDIESSIMEGIIVRMLGNMREAWTHIIDLRPRLGQIDTNPQFAQIVQPTEMTVLVTLETRVADVEGMINFCIPYLTIESVLDKFTTAYWFGNTPFSSKNYKLTEIDDIPVKLTAEVFRREYPLEEVNKWKKGTKLRALRPLVPNCGWIRMGNRRVWQFEVLPDEKWFPKKIKILGITLNTFGSEGKNMVLPNVNPLVADALADAGITISVELGSTAKPVKEILGMGEGTIIELDKLAGEPVDVKANGVLIAKGEVVVIDENFGVRITEIASLGSLAPPPSSQE